MRETVNAGGYGGAIAHCNRAGKHASCTVPDERPEYMLETRDAALFSTASIAFDLDGTLVDTAPDLVRALNGVILPLGLPEVRVEDARAMVGRGARALIERAFERGGRTLPATDADGLVGHFIEIYRADVAAHSRPFEGVVETLDWMRDHGATLSVCTNKPCVLADELVEALGMTHLFVRIVGPERTAAKKPDAGHVRDALGHGHARAGMVGDSAPDVDAARAAGVPSVVLSYGYSEKPAGSLGADRLIHVFRDVPKTLAELWRATA